MQPHSQVKPGDYRKLTSSAGLRLCPARKLVWQECNYDLSDLSTVVTDYCRYCGGKDPNLKEGD